MSHNLLGQLPEVCLGQTYTAPRMFCLRLMGAGGSVVVFSHVTSLVHSWLQSTKKVGDGQLFFLGYGPVMTADQYKALRRLVDSQCAVAEMLGLDKSTLSKRESGERPISIEAALAMQCLAMRANPQLVRQLVKSPDETVKS